MRHRNGAGFTFLELVITVALVSGVLVAAVATSIDLFRSRLKATAITAVNQNARVVLDRVTTAIRNADRVDAAPSVFGSSPGRLSLQMPDTAVSPTLFDVSGTTLRVTEGTGGPVALTSPEVEVTGLTLVHLNQSGSEGVRVSLTLRRQNPRSLPELDVERTYVVGAVIR